MRSKDRSRHTGFLLILCVAASGCHDGGATAPAAPGGSASTGEGGGVSAEPLRTDTVIHVDDDGKSFDVRRGGAVTFKLASNAGTGFIWVPTQVDPAALVQQGDRTTELSSDIAGAPKWDVFHFVAAADGSTSVELSLRRPFGGQAPARVVHVTINVRAP